MEFQDLKEWFFHYSHGLFLTPEKLYNTLVKNKNYSLVFFHSSNQAQTKNLVKKGLMNFENLAEKYKGKLQFAVCDVDLEKECHKLVHLFELEDKKLPYVRILYGMDGKGSHYKVFKLHKEEYKRVELEYDGQVAKYETSLEGIDRLAKKFIDFDVSMDIKN